MGVLWVLAGLFALFGLILLLPLKVRLQYAPARGFSYCVTLLFVPLADSERPARPKSPKKIRPPAPEKTEKKKKSPLPTLLAFLGLSELNTKPKIEAAVAEYGLPSVLADITRAVHRFLSRTLRCLGAGTFRRFTLHIAVGGDDVADAAANYGLTCGAVYSLVSLLSQSMPIRNRSVAVTLADEPSDSGVTADMLLVYRLWHFARYCCFLLGNYLGKERKPS